MNQDGQVIYYAIQGKYINQKRTSEHYRGWFFHADSDVNWFVNGELVLPKNKNDDPTACGNMWQHYGYFGVTNKKAAIRWLNKTIKHHEKMLLKNHPKIKDQEKYKCKWRIVKITKTQKTEPILEMINYGE